MPHQNVFKQGRSAQRQWKTTFVCALAVPLMAACSSGDGPALQADSQSSARETGAAPGQIPGLNLKATTAFETPAPITAASFVPNLIASWFSQIIMVDIDGNLHRAVTSSLKTQPVIKGDYVDVFGFSRRQEAGLFLALTDDGDLEAFIESDDEGNFNRVAISSSAKKLASFCHDSAPLDLDEGGDILWALGVDGTLAKLKIRVNNDTAVSLETIGSANPTKNAPKVTDVCAVSGSKNLVLSESSKKILRLYDEANQSWTKLEVGTPFLDFTVLGLSPTPSFFVLDKPAAKTEDSRLFYHEGASTHPITITNGLSIKGVSLPGFSAVTQAKLGGALNSGALLVSDPQSGNGRIVLMSLDYVKRTLNSPSQ